MFINQIPLLAEVTGGGYAARPPPAGRRSQLAVFTLYSLLFNP